MKKDMIKMHKLWEEYKLQSTMCFKNKVSKNKQNTKYHLFIVFIFITFF